MSSNERSVGWCNFILLMVLLVIGSTAEFLSLAASNHHGYLRSASTATTTSTIDNAWQDARPGRRSKQGISKNRVLWWLDRYKQGSSNTSNDTQQQQQQQQQPEEEQPQNTYLDLWLAEAAKPVNKLTYMMDDGPKARFDRPFVVHWPGAKCVGTLIHEDIVLTAAHCGQDGEDPFEEMLVYLRLANTTDANKGSTATSASTTTNPTSLVVWRAIVHRLVHPLYNAYTHDYDVQVLKLNASALYDDAKHQRTGAQVVEWNREAQVPTAGVAVTNTTGDVLTGTGFVMGIPGAETSAVSSPFTYGNANGTAAAAVVDEFQELVRDDIHVPVLSYQECANAWGPGVIPDTIAFCYGTNQKKQHKQRGNNALFVDSALTPSKNTDITADCWLHRDGGPLLLRGIQVGIATYGDCAELAADTNENTATDNQQRQSNKHRSTGVATRTSVISTWLDDQVCQLSNNPSVLCPPPTPGYSLNPNTVNTKGNATLQVDVQYKGQVAWSLTHMESWTLLFYHAYDQINSNITGGSNPTTSSPSSPLSSQQHTWDHLPAGTYQLQVGDYRQDTGSSLASVAITNGHDELIWKTESGGGGNVTVEFWHVEFQVDDQGRFTGQGHVLDRYTPPGTVVTQLNLADIVNKPSLFSDVNWPGQYPLQVLERAISANVKYDNKADEIQWGFYRYRQSNAQTRDVATNITADADKTYNDDVDEDDFDKTFKSTGSSNTSEDSGNYTNTTTTKLPAQHVGVVTRSTSGFIQQHNKTTAQQRAIDIVTENEMLLGPMRINATTHVTQYYSRNATTLRIKGSEWQPIHVSHPSVNMANTLETQEFLDLPVGLYLFYLQNSGPEKDGLCCRHRQGWITLLCHNHHADLEQDASGGNSTSRSTNSSNSTIVTTTSHPSGERKPTVVWQSDGVFSTHVQVVLELDENGDFHVVPSIEIDDEE